MKKYERLYRELRKKYTDEEIADSMLLPADLTEGEKQKADEELKAFRMKIISEQTEDQRLYSDLLRLRYQLESYVESREYNAELSFGKQLAEYIRILNRTKKQVSEELNVHYTRLSRIINEKEEPNIELVYRLEKHSGELVPALAWWRLIMKKQEHVIQKDKKRRKLEASKVTNPLNLVI